MIPWVNLTAVFNDFEIKHKTLKTNKKIKDFKNYKKKYIETFSTIFLKINLASK